ncbi:MAG: HEAT repeat domain-containing protein [Planctomycetes bacterium]|nr:HEAT repeat domain-containing protein [Planctomycetota bacterium]
MVPNRPAGPTTPGPNGPSAPGPGTDGPTTGGPRSLPAATPGPVTGGPARGPAAGPIGGAGARGPTTGGPAGMPLEDDYDSWDYWWEFNKDRFLQLRASDAPAVQTGGDDFYLGATRRGEARDALRPSTQDAVDVVLPALRQAIIGSPHRDVASACLVAMAKVGRDHPEFTLLELARPMLRSGDQEVRETAALAIGIGARGDGLSLELLAGLALDDGAGRAARGGTVDERMRAFATYGLGLTAQRTGDVQVATRAFGVLRQLLAEGTTAGRDTRIAAIHALGLLRPQERSHAGAKLVDDVVAVLDGYFVRDLGGAEEFVQAHCPTALAKVVGTSGLHAERLRDRWVTVLKAHTQSSRRANPVMQSCVLALGRVLERLPADAVSTADGGARAVLLDVAKDHPDRLSRHFALVALAQSGGRVAERALLAEFERTSQVQRKAWAALALGLLVHGDRTANGIASPDSPAIAVMHAELRTAKEPGLVGALGVALGLCGATDAADTMRARLRDGITKEKMAGYLCVGLALLSDRSAIDDVREVAEFATRRPELMVQAALALGRLGDQAIVDDILRWMAGSEVNLSRLAALSTALARIGDRRSLAPLVRMLHDRELGTLPRAFAAVALGGVCDGRAVPWNTPIAVDTNYRAAVPTLSDQQSGILDIL